jgi:hypothetical protein
MKKLYNTDIIDRFNAGELTGNELEEFTKKMESNKEFAEYVKLSKKVDSFLQNNLERLEFREQLENIYKKTIINKHKKNFINKKIQIFSFQVSNKIAASTVFLIISITFLFLYLRPPINKRLYSQYFHPYDASEITRGNNEKTNTDKYSEAIKLYNDKEYQQSYFLLNEYCKGPSLSQYEYERGLFLKGISAMEINNFEEAITSFNIILKNKNSLYSESAEWYLALCYLKKNNITISKYILHQISISDSYYRNQAELISLRLK